jgi:hypothetical protein
MSVIQWFRSGLRPDVVSTSSNKDMGRQTNPVQLCDHGDRLVFVIPDYRTVPAPPSSYMHAIREFTGIVIGCNR